MNELEKIDSIDIPTLLEYDGSKEHKGLPSIRGNEDVQTPSIQAPREQQDFKTTVNAFQYTGKGSVIDTIF